MKAISRDECKKSKQVVYCRSMILQVWWWEQIKKKKVINLPSSVKLLNIKALTWTAYWYKLSLLSCLCQSSHFLYVCNYTEKIIFTICNKKANQSNHSTDKMHNPEEQMKKEEKKRKSEITPLLFPDFTNNSFLKACHLKSGWGENFFFF